MRVIHRMMRRPTRTGLSWAALMAAGLGVACSTGSTPWPGLSTGGSSGGSSASGGGNLTCVGDTLACSCRPATDAGPSTVSTCGSLAPTSACCADPTYPGSGQCACHGYGCVITNSISPGFCECANTSPGTVEALQCTAPPGGACCRETSGVLTLTARCYCAQSCSDGVLQTHGRMSPASTKKPRLVMSMLTLERHGLLQHHGEHARIAGRKVLEQLVARLLLGALIESLLARR